jgi:hypothetical protein
MYLVKHYFEDISSAATLGWRRLPELLGRPG